MSIAMRKPAFCICENKDAAKIDQRLCFRYTDSSIPKFLYSKFQASSRLLWLHRSVCVGPGRKTRKPVFSQQTNSCLCIWVDFDLRRIKSQAFHLNDDSPLIVGNVTHGTQFCITNHVTSKKMQIYLTLIYNNGHLF